MASCIGETSASACRKNEWEEKYIFFPEKPGVDGWATAVADALELVAK
jgi:uroporphyrinogen-III synthase